jgi:23S rRNA (guanosine2251-2'-O)-methyltransferase
MKQKQKKNKFSQSAYWIGGKHAVEAALNNPNRKKLILVKHKKFLGSETIINNVEIDYQNDDFFKKIFNNEIPHQGYALLIEKIKENNIQFYIEQNKINNVLALDGVTDPRNIGSIIRTAVAFGYEAILINKKNFNPKSFLLFKAASGALEKIILIETSNILNEIKILKSNNFWVLGMDGNATQSLYNYEPQLKNLIIFGSESSGMKNLIKTNCDEICKIPINSNNVQSLNVSNAVASALSILNYKKYIQ